MLAAVVYRTWNLGLGALSPAHRLQRQKLGLSLGLRRKQSAGAAAWRTCSGACRKVMSGLTRTSSAQLFSFRTHVTALEYLMYVCNNSHLQLLDYYAKHNTTLHLTISQICLNDKRFNVYVGRLLHIQEKEAELDDGDEDDDLDEAKGC